MFQIKVVENIKTHISYSVTFFYFENGTVYEVMWKNVVQLGRPQFTIWRIRFASWMPKATNTYLEHVIRIALPLQQCLHERSSVLRYTYIACPMMC